MYTFTNSTLSTCFQKSIFFCVLIFVTVTNVFETRFGRFDRHDRTYVNRQKNENVSKRCIGPFGPAFIGNYFLYVLYFVKNKKKTNGFVEKSSLSQYGSRAEPSPLLMSRSVRFVVVATDWIHVRSYYAVPMMYKVLQRTTGYRVYTVFDRRQTGTWRKCATADNFTTPSTHYGPNRVIFVRAEVSRCFCAGARARTVSVSRIG